MEKLVAKFFTSARNIGRVAVAGTLMSGGYVTRDAKRLLSDGVISFFGLGMSCRRFSNFEAEPFLRRDVRRKDVLAKNPNQLNALMNGPDYTFVDGRPTPYGSRQLGRMEKQKQYTAKIIQMTREVDMAKAAHKGHVIEREQEIRNIIDSKLKPKGKKILVS